MKEIHKIAVFFDGTWNTVDYPDKISNVKKLKDYTVKRYQEEDELFITDLHYMEGPGTRPGTGVWGGAFAGDLDKIICDAYIWLTQKYHLYHQAGHTSEIYIFGFSRGAYLAHIFSWLLNDVGVTSNFSLIPQITKLYMTKDEKTIASLMTGGTGCVKHVPTVRMLGLWDMVTAPLDSFSGYHDGNLAPVVKQVYHAMALDEKRIFFPVLKYHEKIPAIHQRWFSGVHSDIGGGYEDSTLSDIALNWMMEMAINEDLILKDITASAEQQSSEDFVNMEKHDEAGSQNNPRKYNFESIDDSVFRRMAHDSSYAPYAVNFPDKA